MKKDDGQKKRGVIYARYSAGPHQTDQSIEGQVRDCTRYAEAHNIELIEVYADRAISGRSMVHRLELQRLLRDAGENKFDVVVTWKVDRLGRNRTELALNKFALKKNGVKVVYAEESIPDGPEGIILESVLEGIAEYYSADLSQKIRRGQRESVMKGRVQGCTKAYGYDIGKDLHPTVNKDEAAIVQDIFRMYANGMDIVEIIKYLTDRGLSYRSRDWSHNAIRHVLRNECYIGAYHFGENENNDIFPPIIDDDLWNKVQKRIKLTSVPKTHAAAGGRHTASSVDFYLSGRITCGICGSTYCGESGKGKNGTMHYYYKCHARKKNAKSCPDSPVFRKDALEEMIINCAVKDLLTDEMIWHIAELWEKNEDTRLNTDEAAIYRNALVGVEKKIKNIMTAIEEGIFTDTTKSRLEALEAQRDTLKAQIADAEIMRPRINKDIVAYFLTRLKEKDPTDPAYREDILQGFVDQVIVERDAIYVAYSLFGKDRTISAEEFSASVRPLATKLELCAQYPNSR